MVSPTPKHCDKRWNFLGAAAGQTALAHGAALLCLAVAGPALADEGLHAFAVAGMTHDDNLFRLPDNAPGYDGRRGDTMRQGLAGLSFDQTYGREVVHLVAKASRVNFEHFTQLNYNGKNLVADLNWHLGNHLEGTLGATYDEVLAPYTDVVTRDRNLRTQRRDYGTANWSFHPSWRLRTEGSRDRYRYDLSTLAYNDRTDDNYVLGVDYGVSSGSTVGLQAGHTSIRYDQLRLVNGQRVDAGSDQRDIKLKVRWRVTPVTDVQFLGGWAERTHPFYTERNASGVNARLQASTLAAGNLTLGGSLWREFAGAENNIVSYSLNNGANLTGQWRISAKLQADAQMRYERRVFRGLLARQFSLDLQDSSRSGSLGLTYLPTRSVQLSTSLSHDSRAGQVLVGNGSYRSTALSFNATLQY